jgi:hypothetical protein
MKQRKRSAGTTSRPFFQNLYLYNTCTYHERIEKICLECTEMDCCTCSRAILHSLTTPDQDDETARYRANGI